MAFFAPKPPGYGESTPLTRAIIQYCTRRRVQPDWGAIIQVCDLFNTSRDKNAIVEGIRILRKQIQGKDPRLILAALELTGALVKNGDAFLHTTIGSSKFMHSMAKLAEDMTTIGPMEDVAVKARELIQQWGNEFVAHAQTTRGRLFVQTYQELRRKGVRFRAGHVPAAPILMPEREAAPRRSAPAPAPAPAYARARARGSSPGGSPGRGSGSRGGGGGGVPRPTTVSTKAAAVLGAIDAKNTVLISTLAMLLEMMQHVSSAAECAGDEVITQLAQQCNTARPRIQNSVQQAIVGNPAAVSHIIELNDSLNTILAFYEHVKRLGPPPKAAPPTPATVRVELGQGQGEEPPASIDSLLGTSLPQPRKAPVMARVVSGGAAVAHAQAQAQADPFGLDEIFAAPVSVAVAAPAPAPAPQANVDDIFGVAAPASAVVVSTGPGSGSSATATSAGFNDPFFSPRAAARKSAPFDPFASVVTAVPAPAQAAFDPFAAAGPGRGPADPFASSSASAMDPFAQAVPAFAPSVGAPPPYDPFSAPQPASRPLAAARPPQAQARDAFDPFI